MSIEIAKNNWWLITCVMLMLMSGLRSRAFAADPDPAEPSWFDSTLIKNPVITATDYEGLLQYVLDWAGELQEYEDDNARANIRSAFQSLRRQIPPAYTFDVWVSYGDPDSVRAFDTTVVTSNDWLLNVLDELSGEDKDAEDIERIRNNIRQVLPAVATLKSYILIRDSSDYKKQFSAILKRQEYREKKNRNLLQEAFNWILDQLASIFGSIFKNSRSMEPAVEEPRDYSLIGKALLYTAYGIGAVTVLWLVLHVYRYFRRSKQDRLSEKSDFGNLIEPGESTEPDEHFRLAQHFAQERNFRKAIRHLFLSIILYLDRNDHIRYQKFQTNSEYLEALLKADHLNCRDELHERMKKMSVIFDETWYGMKPATEDHFTETQLQYRGCLDAVRQTKKAESAA